jgi:putative endonuclease
MREVRREAHAREAHAEADAGREERRAVLRSPKDGGWRKRRGDAAEEAVVRWLGARGARVLDRNVRVGRLEIDVVVCDGPVVALVEVRTRGPRAWERPIASVRHEKRDRLRRAAAILWARRFSKLPGVERLRFDVAAVDLDGAAEPVVEYVRGAFV